MFPLLALFLVGAGGEDPQRELRELVNTHMREARIPGLSIAIARGDELLFAEGFGYADVEHGVPVSAETVFRTGSITKQFTAAAIVLLEESGELAVSDELSEWVPEFDSRGHEITLHQLLTHTSGVPNLTAQIVWYAKLRLDLDHGEMLELVRGVPFDFEPGTSWRYSNTGYYLLGMVIEAATGGEFERFLAERFFEPLELSATRVERNTPLIPHRARGYQIFFDELHNAGFLNIRQPFAAGAIASTAGDLVRWQHALVSGEVVSRAGYERMTTPAAFGDPGAASYGYGLVLDELDGVQRSAHRGSIHGFRSILAYYPEPELSICVLANLEGAPVDRIERELARLFLGIEILDLPLAAGELVQYEGDYRAEGWALSVREREGELRAKDQRLGSGKLLFQGGREFRHEKDDRVRYVFCADEEGVVGVERHGEGDIVLHAERR